MQTFEYDIADELIVSMRTWTVNKEGYVRCTVPIGQERFLHRVLMGAGPADEIDHIDGNPSNCKRNNLRRVTHQQNAAARSMPARSLPRGVSLDKKTGRYISVLRVNGKLKWLGRWDTAEQAALVRDKAAYEAFGEYAVLNYPNIWR